MFNITNMKKDIKIKILSVGRLETQKNYTSLIKNLMSSNIFLDIVGDGSERSDLEN